MSRWPISVSQLCRIVTQANFLFKEFTKIFAIAFGCTLSTLQYYTVILSFQFWKYRGVLYHFFYLFMRAIFLLHVYSICVCYISSRETSQNLAHIMIIKDLESCQAHALIFDLRLCVKLMKSRSPVLHGNTFISVCAHFSHWSPLCEPVILHKVRVKNDGKISALPFPSQWSPHRASFPLHHPPSHWLSVKQIQRKTTCMLGGRAGSVGNSSTKMRKNKSVLLSSLLISQKYVKYDIANWTS